jgi:hypothetical protein
MEGHRASFFHLLPRNEVYWYLPEGMDSSGSLGLNRIGDPPCFLSPDIGFLGAASWARNAPWRMVGHGILFAMPHRSVPVLLSIFHRKWRGGMYVDGSHWRTPGENHRKRRLKGTHGEEEEGSGSIRISSQGGGRPGKIGLYISAPMGNIGIRYLVPPDGVSLRQSPIRWGDRAFSGGPGPGLPWILSTVCTYSLYRGGPVCDLLERPCAGIDQAPLSSIGDGTSSGGGLCRVKYMYLRSYE